jgi:transcription initiation factor IIE alpha subunit
VRFDCPRCGDEITTETSVGEFTKCETCKADLKILGEDIAAVFTGDVSFESGSTEEHKLHRMAEAEYQTAVLTATENITENNSINQYSCPCCLSLVITEGGPGENTRCEDCGADLKIISEDSLALISDTEEKIENKPENETRQNLTLKIKNNVKPPEADGPGPPRSFPRILRFTCPQCDEEVKTQRNPGESFLCYKCGGELRILSEDAVTLILGDDESKQQLENKSSHYQFQGKSGIYHPKSSGKLKAIRRLVIGSLLGIILMFVAVILFLEISRNEIIVYPINVPHGMQQDGFTPEVIATRIIDQMHYISNQAGVGESGVQTKRAKIDKPASITLAGTGSVWTTLSAPVKELLGRHPAEISGEFIACDKILCLTMRISQKDGYQDITRRDIYGPSTEIDLIFHEAAGFAMEITQPNTFALFLENKDRADADYDFRVVMPEDIDQNTNPAASNE